MKKPAESRRGQARVPYEHHVVINGCLRVKAIDISEGGLYLHTGRAFPAGSIVEVTFPIHCDYLTVKTEVRFSHEGVGMGLLFRNLNSEQHTIIKSYIDNALISDETIAGAKKKVLLYADNCMGATMYRSELTLAQFSVLHAETTGEAINLLKTQEIRAIVLAIDMERLENLNVLTLLKLSPTFTDIPVVVVSPANRLDTAKRIYNIGADVFLEKRTAAPKKVVEEVKKLLKK